MLGPIRHQELTRASAALAPWTTLEDQRLAQLAARTSSFVRIATASKPSWSDTPTTRDSRGRRCRQVALPSSATRAIDRRATKATSNRTGASQAESA